ncbi:MAG: tetratricopeptide repeat protein [Muribaculaceae bacterium]|nr:tetratricopeptide repeat protein [Muribaculaceae bacterium]
MRDIVIVILSILLLSACGNREQVQFEKLQLIDSIAEVNADSAVTMIKTINRDTLSGDNNKYYYDLLKIRTNDKAYIAHTSDSAILSIINYFENNDFNNLLPVAYYYGGRVYSDLGDAPQALEYFHKALDCENINPLTQAVTYSQIAGIYNRQNIYELAIPAYKKAIELNSKNNNHVNALYNIHNLSGIYSKQGLKDSALVLYNQIIRQAEELGHTKLIYSTKLNIAELYLFKSDYKQALKISNSLKCVLPKEDSTKIANTFAHLYYRLNNTDSTIFFCNKLIKSKNLNAQLNGYNILANLYINQNNLTKATPFIIESQLLSDSIRKLNTPYEIRQLSSIYNYQIRERENNKLKQEAHENEIKIISLCCSIVFLLIITLFIIYITRKRKRIIKLKLQNVEMLLKQSNEFSENTIAENKEKISLLECQIESISSENTSLIQELEQQKKLLELNNEKANIFKIQKDSAIIAFNNDTFIIDLHNRLKNYPEGKNVISEKEWNIVSEKTSTLFPTFINTIRELPFKLSLYEFRVSILIKTKFTPKEIARLTNHSESSVSLTRARLYKKLTNDNGRASDWDNFINGI